jgi:hypothetical protein
VKMRSIVSKDGSSGLVVLKKNPRVKSLGSDGLGHWMLNTALCSKSERDKER